MLPATREGLQEAFSTIDLRTARATSKADEDMISEVVLTSAGFDAASARARWARTKNYGEQATDDVPFIIFSHEHFRHFPSSTAKSLDKLTKSTIFSDPDPGIVPLAASQHEGTFERIHRRRRRPGAFSEAVLLPSRLGKGGLCQAPVSQKLTSCLEESHLCGQRANASEQIGGSQPSCWNRCWPSWNLLLSLQASWQSKAILRGHFKEETIEVDCEENLGQRVVGRALGRSRPVGLMELFGAENAWSGVLGFCNHLEVTAAVPCCSETAAGCRDARGRLLTGAASLPMDSVALRHLDRISPHLLVRLSIPSLTSGTEGEAVLQMLAEMREDLKSLKEVFVHITPPRLPRVTGESRATRSEAVSVLAGALSAALPCWLDSFEANLRGGCLLAGDSVLADLVSAIPKHLTRLGLDLNHFSSSDAQAVAKSLPSSLRELRLLFHGRSFAPSSVSRLSNYLLRILEGGSLAPWLHRLRALRRVPLDFSFAEPYFLEMSLDKDFKNVASWNGEPTSWNDYARQVRLQWERTPTHKRRLLGAELASRLTSRAWAVTPDLDHKKLGKKNGAKYLLKFLQDRLCRTAIPDAGARLEDLLIRLRRPLGMSMGQWSNELLEAYRKVQRAMIRARQLQQAKEKPDTRSEPEPAREPSSSPTSLKSPTSPKSPTRSSTMSPTRRTGVDPIQEEEEGGTYEPVPQDEPEAGDDGYVDWWSPEEWRKWRKEQRKLWEDDDTSSGEDLPWDELQTEELQVLPDEVLGWLLLRRANLSSSNRLSVQASVGNSLRFSDLEMALRDQEEELLAADHGRGGHQSKKRSYWIEEDGCWGMIVTQPDEFDENEVHWVGHQLPNDVYDPGINHNPEEDDEVYWSWEVDGWHGYVPDGYGFWLETDGMGTYWTAEDSLADLSPEESKELEEAYMAYENKARTFLQSRQLQRAKGTSRGFFPLSMMKGGGRKGKSKGKGKKGKGYGGGGTTSSTMTSTPSKPLFAAQGESSTTTTSSGCFICGDKSHGFRSCPRRTTTNASSTSKGGKKGAYWVESLTTSSLAFVGMVHMVEDTVVDTAGYGVLDLGATETVGSLEALEALMEMRSRIHGIQEPVEVYSGWSGKKPFRFGNGAVQFSSSYITIPQRLGDQLVHLGMYTIDAEKVPILVGIKTLTKLGSVIDVSGRWMVLSNVSPEVKIPLARSKAGHLLVNLTQDWLTMSRPLQPVPTEGAYMVRSLDWEVEVSGHEVQVIPNIHINDTMHTINNMHMLEKPSPNVVSEPHVEDVWMMNDDGESDGNEGENEDDSAFLMGPDHSHQPLPSATQEMRDQILRRLVSPARSASTSSESHAAQECDDHGQRQGETESQGAGLGEVRLGSHDRSRSPGPTDSRSTMLRRAHPRADGAWLEEWRKSPCSVGELRGVWSEAQLHSNLGMSRSDDGSRPTSSGHQGPDLREAAREEERGAGGQEDRPGCAAALLGEAAQEGAGQEGGVAEDPNVQGREDPGLLGRAERAEHRGMAQGGRQVPRVYGPNSSGIRFNAFGVYVKPYMPTDDTRGARQVQEAAGGGDEREAGPQSPESGGISGGSGVCSEDSGAGRLVSPDSPVETEKMKPDGKLQGVSYEANDAWNSTSMPISSTTSMASFSKTPVIDLTEGNRTGFTTSGTLPTTTGILPTESADPVSAMPFSRGKRKKDEGENEVMVNKLDDEDTAFLVQELDKFNSEVDELFVTLNALIPDGRPPTVMELCCEEDSGLTKAIELRGGRGLRCGLFNGCDLSKQSGFNKVKTLIEQERPDVVWVALPCGPTSTIQELNKLTPEGLAKVEAKVAKSRKLAGRAVTLMELQVARGGEVVQEWPRHNKGWKFNSIQTFWNRREHHEALVDGCAYGLCAPCGGAIKKPWRLRSTTRRIWKMQRLCQCHQPHVPCEGGDLTRRTAFYPVKMCQQAARMVEEVHGDLMASTYAVTDATDCDMDCLKAYTDQEVQTTAGEVLKLHRKLGHPSRQAFLKMLRDRGAGQVIRTLASIVHCPDCHEAAVPPARRAVTIEQATELWEVLQVDNMEVTVGDFTYHFQLMVDEASGYGAANFLFKHTATSSRNATTMECIEALYRGWIQYFGYPKMIKLDKEGAHRGRQLEEWGEGHGVEVQAVPAESHGQIGQVERLIGTLKRKMLAHLRSSDGAPEVAAWAMIGAHNTMSNIGGYSPSQWVFGRNPTDSLRLFDGHDLPYWSGMASSAKMQHQLACRQEAERNHRDFILKEKVNLAHRTQMPKVMRFDPGALVYYKRFQPPADKAERSHQALDVPRRKVARWYGPARVLAVETKVTYDGAVRQPHNVAWIIASGRLKKVHTNQLRYASEREQLIAQGTTQLTLPWTFQDLTPLINKGEYDDEIMTERQMRADAKKSKMDFEEQQRQQRSVIKRQLEEDSSSTGQEKPSASSASRPRTLEKAENVPIEEETEEDEVLEDEEMDSRHRVQPGLDADRLMNDPGHFPMPPPDPAPLYRHPLFLQARRQHEMSERPFHVQRREFLQRGTLDETVDENMLVDEATEINEIFLAQIEHYAYAVTLPTPSTEAEWRSIVKDPSRFVAKKLAKGVEVSWQRLNNEQRAAMKEAKGIEIKEWLAAKVCKVAVGEVPADRIMRMRWVLVLKGTDDPKVVKAKARLVIVGFTDPDLGMEEVRSPTISRRGRQCLLQLGNHRGWSTLKSDAKAAFLQTGDTQQQRQIFGMPVTELQEAMDLPPGRAVQFLKAAYGLTVAPKEFYQHVDGILQKLKLTRLKIDPAIWVLKELDAATGKMVVYGAVGAHVDDFLMIGDEKSKRWCDFLQSFHASLKWSPWECAPMTHCGIWMEQDAQNTWHLSQAEFCEGLNQVTEDGKGKDLTPNEMHQCRAILGAAQWRSYQTAPQHAAKLSHLQSLLPRGDRSTLKDINKFVREIYHQKDEKISVYDLKAEYDSDIIAVGWSDAALANRVDLSSTGGYMIGFAHRKMLDGVQGPVSMVSWSTHKLRRVCRSSLAAEAQALAECEAELFLVRGLWQELLGADLDLKNPWNTTKETPGVLVVDAKALYDTLRQQDVPNLSAKEKHTALEVMGLSQHLVEQGTTLRWCNSDQQLADGMTKISAQDRISNFIKGNQRWNLLYDESFTAAKKLKAAKTAAEPDLEVKDPTWLDLMRWKTIFAVRCWGLVEIEKCNKFTKQCQLLPDSQAWLGSGVESSGTEELASALPASLEKLHLMLESSAHGASTLCQALPPNLRHLALDLQMTLARGSEARLSEALAAAFPCHLAVLQLRLTDFNMSLAELRTFADSLPQSLTDLRIRYCILAMMADIEATVLGDPLFHPMLQFQRRIEAGLENDTMRSFLGKTKFVSLGSFCGVAQALQMLGLRGAAGPFDWMRSRCEGVTQLLATNFKDFLTMEPPFIQQGGSHVFPMAWGGSYWHHNIADKEVQQTMERRKQRFLSMSDENLIFIRSVNCTDELRAIPHLIQALKARFPRSNVRLLVLVDYQDCLNEAIMQELGQDVIFSLVSSRVWDTPLQMPEWDPSYMRKRMELESYAYAGSIARALRIWSGTTSVWSGAGTFSLFPSLESYRNWVSPFTGPDPKVDGFRGRRLPRAVPPAVPAATYLPLQATVSTMRAKAPPAVASSRKQRLDICCRDVGDDGAQALASNLPEGLECLFLCLRDWRFSAVGLRVLTAALPKNLRRLKLAFSSSPIGASGARALTSHLPTTLSCMNLSLRHCSLGRDGEQALRPLARRWNPVPHSWVRIYEKTAVSVGLRHCSEWDLWDRL
eukprot:s1073_g5.t2